MIIKAIIILILFCLIGFGIAYCIRQYNTNSCNAEKTDIKCDGGICPVPEEWENGSN